MKRFQILEGAINHSLDYPDDTMGISLLKLQSNFGKLVSGFVDKRFGDMDNKEIYVYSETMMEFVNTLHELYKTFRIKDIKLTDSKNILNTKAMYTSAVNQYGGLSIEWLFFRMADHVGRLMGKFKHRDASPDISDRMDSILAIMTLMELFIVKFDKMLQERSIVFDTSIVAVQQGGLSESIIRFRKTYKLENVSDTSEKEVETVPTNLIVQNIPHTYENESKISSDELSSEDKNEDDKND